MIDDQIIIPEDAPLHFIGEAEPSPDNCPFCIRGTWMLTDEAWMKWRVIHDTEHDAPQAGAVMNLADLQAAMAELNGKS